MAEVVLKVILEGAQQAESGIEGVAKSFGDVGAASKKAGSESTKAFKETTIEGEKLKKTLESGIPKIDFKKPAQSIQELKAQIRQFTSDAIKAGEGTKEFARLIGEAGKRKADLKDLQQAVAALDPDTKGKAFLQLSQTIISGFAAGQGALAAFGITTEDAQKTLVKLQAALAFGQFLGQVGELGDTFRILKTQIQNSEVAQKAFNLVSKANPYVLIATAIAAAGVAILAFNSTTEENTTTVDKNSEAFKDNEERVRKAQEAREKLQVEIEDLTLKILNESGALSDRAFELAKIEQEAGRERIKIRKQTLEQLGLTEENYFNDSSNNAAAEEFKKKGIEEAIAKNSILLEETIAKRKLEVNTRFNKKDNEESIKRINANAKIIRDGLEFIRKENDKADDEYLESKEILNKKKDELEKTATANSLSNIVAVTDAQKLANEDAAKEDERRLAEIQAQQQAQLALASQFGSLLADLVGATASNNQKTFEEASKGILLLLVNTLEKSVLASVLAAQATSTALSFADPKSIATGGIAGIAQSALLTALITAAFQGFKAAIAQISFAEGGYTGDGGKYQEAGIVHKGEFVTTKENTAKHRGLLEAIHNDKAPSIADISGLLMGTGIVLMPEVAGRISNELTASGNQKLYQQQFADKNIEELNKNFKKWMSEQGKNSEKILPDGTRVIKVGNTTRTIRRK